MLKFLVKCLLSNKFFAPSASSSVEDAFFEKYALRLAEEKRKSLHSVYTASSRPAKI